MRRFYVPIKLDIITLTTHLGGGEPVSTRGSERLAPSGADLK